MRCIGFKYQHDHKPFLTFPIQWAFKCIKHVSLSNVPISKDPAKELSWITARPDSCGENVKSHEIEMREQVYEVWSSTHARIINQLNHIFNVTAQRLIVGTKFYKQYWDDTNKLITATSFKVTAPTAVALWVNVLLWQISDGTGCDLMISCFYTVHYVL